MEFLTTIIELWNDGWYWKTMIISAFTLIIGILTWAVFGKSYFLIEETIESEFDRLSMDHWFLSFRKNKRAQLYSQAVNKASKQYPVKFPQYTMCKTMGGFMQLSFSILFFLGIGGGIYHLLNDYDPNPVVEDGYYEEYDSYIEYENVPDDQPGVHHVDPHYVEGYYRDDGTYVEGYQRGGESGYYRSDPDGSTSNNIGGYINDMLGY